MPSHHRSVHTLRAAVLAGVLCISGCATDGPRRDPGSPGAPGSRTPTAAHSPTGPSTPVAVAASGTAGNRTWTWSSDSPATPRVLGGSFLGVEQTDSGQWLLVRRDGRASAIATTTGVTFTVQRGALVAKAPAAATTVRELGAPLTARWTPRDGQRSLRVDPTKAARGWITEAASLALWVETVAQVPDADSPGMQDQLLCHMHFAPGKNVWFLEPDRPAVGYAGTVAAACNPGNVADGG